MEIGNGSGFVVGGNTESTGKFCSYLTKDFVIVCYEERYDENGNVYWDFPFILETAMQKDPNTGEISRASYFRPMIPVSKTMKVYPMEYTFMCRIEDPKMENAYRQSVQQLRMQMSGIVMPNGEAATTESGIITS